MEQNQQNMDARHDSSTVYILSLLVIFALGALMMVLYGANSYHHIQQETRASDQKRIPLAYIASKVRQYDQEGCLTIAKKQGNRVLVLETIDGGLPCETWIYTYQGDLYEMYVDKGAQFDLSQGEIIIPQCRLDMSLEQGLLTLVAYDEQGNSQQLCLATSSGLEGGADND